MNNADLSAQSDKEVWCLKQEILIAKFVVRKSVLTAIDFFGPSKILIVLL